MQIPKKPRLYSVEFRYSQIYDEQCRAAYYLRPKHERPYPDPSTIKKYMNRLEKEWRKTEREVFFAIQKYSGIKWIAREHICYVVGSGDPFSDPLTISVFAPDVPIDYVVDVLCHELIHRNLMEPVFETHWKKMFSKLQKKYPNDTENVVDHVIVHAIHEQIFLSVFSESRLLREKRVMSPYPDYERAWKIVEKIGSKKIIETYLR